MNGTTAEMRIGRVAITTLQADITTLSADAIVNSSNTADR
jgi:O-acetyl-ADP-ribose deacetylase (regulator of RNase III)